jgi:hypothetical protein
MCDLHCTDFIAIEGNQYKLFSGVVKLRVGLIVITYWEVVKRILRYMFRNVKPRNSAFCMYGFCMILRINSSVLLGLSQWE